MMFKLKKYIAATSLIEIMMIFFIIGIVTTAGMGLTKPKDEYMKKVAVYSAYRDLSVAAMNIKNGGYINFTTDMGICAQRDTSSGYCKDYLKDGIQANNFIINDTLALPKVASRSAYNNSSKDPQVLNTNYASLSTDKKLMFKVYQSGLCQRLAMEFNLSAVDNVCPTSNSALLDDSDGFINDFRGQTPALYLPNGYVYYISKNLYVDFGPSFLKQTVVTQAPDILSSLGRYTTYENMAINSSSTASTLYSALSLYNASSASAKLFIKMPNETRLQIAYKALNTDAYNSNLWVEYQKNYWSQNKDYFNVYIDINGKMGSGANADPSKGPDMLNKDVFLFHVYRNGTVIPAYESGFPKNYLTAGLTYKKKVGSLNYSFTFPQYSTIPLVYAMCKAGIAGDPRKAVSSDGTKWANFSPQMCGATNATSTYPYASCYGKDDSNRDVIDYGNPQCNIKVNRPSFFVK